MINYSYSDVLVFIGSINYTIYLNARQCILVHLSKFEESTPIFIPFHKIHYNIIRYYFD